jgi:Ca2+-binding EF-hand superfamily protein
MDKDTYLSDENIRAAFDHFDTEGEGLITDRSIAKSFYRASKNFNEEEVEAMMVEAVGQESINYEEFQNLMKCVIIP